MRASVTIEGVDGAWTVTFSEQDNELLNAMKQAIPPAARRYDSAGRRWRLAADTHTMEAVCDAFERLGAPIAKPSTLGMPPAADRDPNQLELLEQKLLALESAANWMRRQITQLEEERDELSRQLRSRPTQSSPSANWAEVLFTALPPDLRTSVFKALTRSLHPDVLGPAGTALQQQLNVARESWG